MSIKLKEFVKAVVDEALEEANALSTGGGSLQSSGQVVGYTGPLGGPTIGTDPRLEKGFWRDKAKKKVKTASPALHELKVANNNDPSFLGNQRQDALKNYVMMWQNFQEMDQGRVFHQRPYRASDALVLQLQDENASWETVYSAIAKEAFNLKKQNGESYDYGDSNPTEMVLAALKRIPDIQLPPPPEELSEDLGAMEDPDVETPRMVKLLWPDEKERKEKVKTDSPAIHESRETGIKVNRFIERINHLMDIRPNIPSGVVAKIADSFGFQELGSGLSRIAFDVGHGFVIKVEFNDEGQNRNEIKTADCLTQKFATKIYEWDRVKFRWLIAEKVRVGNALEVAETLATLLNMNDEQVKEAGILGETFIEEVFRHALVGVKKKRTEDYEIRSPWFKEFREKLSKCNVSGYDFHLHNWGFRQNSELVLLDYGFPLDESVQLNEAESKFDKFTKAIEQVTMRKIQLKDKDGSAQNEIRALGQKFGFPLLGKGISRMAFDVGDKVLKVEYANTMSDQGQNRNEVEAGKCLGSKYATKIYAYDKAWYSWILSEKVSKLKEKQFVEKLREVFPVQAIDSLDLFTKFVRALIVPDAKLSKELRKNSWFMGLKNAVNSCNVDPSDFHVNNWGMRNNGDLVLLDYGFSTKPVLHEANSLMTKMGYTYVGKSSARLGSETYLYKNDKEKAKQTKLVKTVNKNLDKTRGDTLKDPGGMGISLPKKMRG